MDTNVKLLLKMGKMAFKLNKKSRFVAWALAVYTVALRKQ